MGILGMILAGAASFVLPILMSYYFTKKLIGITLSDLVRGCGDVILVTVTLVGVAVLLRVTQNLGMIWFILVGAAIVGMSGLYAGITGLKLIREGGDRFRPRLENP
jgi:hypothetical protein